MVFTRGASIKQSEIEMEIINSFSRREIGEKNGVRKKLSISKEERHPFTSQLGEQALRMDLVGN